MIRYLVSLNEFNYRAGSHENDLTSSSRIGRRRKLNIAGVSTVIITLKVVESAD